MDAFFLLLSLGLFGLAIGLAVASQNLEPRK